MKQNKLQDLKFKKVCYEKTDKILLEKNKILLGFVMLALLTIILGCAEKTTRTGENIGTDSRLNGTWVTVYEQDQYLQETELKLNNGNFEINFKVLYIDSSIGWFYDGPYSKGTFATNNGHYSSQTTHIHGGYFLEMQPLLGFTSRWYQKDEYLAQYKAYYLSMGITEEQFNTTVLPSISLVFEPTTSEYSISGGNTLIIDSITYTKK